MLLVYTVLEGRYTSLKKSPKQFLIERESTNSMFHVATSDLLHLLASYGYWAVLVFVGIESIGIPLPGETMPLLAAIYAGTTRLPQCCQKDESV